MENKLRYSVYVVAMLFLSPPLWALSDAEVEARLDQYAAKIKALEAELADAKKTPVYEQDVGKSSSKIEKQIQQIKDKMTADDQRVHVNGFMTAAVSMADDNIGGTYDIQNKPSFAGDSKMGLQFNYKMDDKADATVQLLARSRGQSLGNSSDPWQVSAEWAYLGYQVTDDLKVRMGRLRIPFYMYSETLDVGYTYPWVRPPMEMYVTAITSYNGADMLYKFSTGSMNHTLQLFTGASSSTATYGNNDTVEAVDIQDMAGINLTSSVGSWTFRAMATHLSINGDVAQRADTVFDAGTLAGVDPTTDLNPFVPGTQTLPGMGGFDSCDMVDIDPTPGTTYRCLPGGYLHKTGDDTFDYYSLGTQYDDGSLFVIAEVAKAKTDRARIFSDAVQGYVTAGYRMGSWTPYATYAHTYDTESTAFLATHNLNPLAVSQSQKERSIGLRHELTSSLSAKLEWNNMYDLEGQSPSLGDDYNIYTFALDVVF